jgi:integrase
MLSARDLQSWRDNLIEKMEPSSVNRTCNGLRAALELAADLDDRIANRRAFRLGLRRLPGANKARRIVMPDEDVLRIVKAAYEIDRAFGLLIETLAVTGARLSQAARLTCADLQADRAAEPRLMIPSSFKGRGQKKFSHRPVPITPALGAALNEAKGDRPWDAPLLLKRDGTPWQATSTGDHRKPFRQTVELAGLDPDRVTSYALRHSSIVRSLLGGVPVTVVAQQHDTSVREIEARAAAEAEFELARARAVIEAVLTRAGNTAEWNGGPGQGTALINVLPKLQKLERYERRAFSKRRRALRDL